MSYDENSIRVLNLEEIEERFPFVRIQALALKYGKDPQWLKRLFEACFLAGVSVDWAISRYLKKEDFPRNKEVEAIHSELAQEYFRK